MIHLDPYLYTIRFFDEGNCFENKDPYRAIMTVFISGSLARAMGAHGDITRSDLKELLIELDKLGSKTLTIERNGKEVVYNISDYLKKV